MMDIDHFKRFNDKYGHAAGDELLKEMGKLLYAHIRMADIACRYGGEEFVLVLPDASLEVSRQRAERLRQEVKQLRLKIKNQNMGAITVSLGVAVFPDNGSSGKALLKSADAALYLAKRAGRDRVVMAA
jgi:diguanylate cyclase (GGDEF)-like protein